jgi:hypothetical protein
MITTILSIICVALAGISNSIWQTTNQHYSTSIFDDIALDLYKRGVFKDILTARQWFNYDNNSWLNKYVDRNPAKGLIKWRLWGITFTKPVQITDCFHFFIMLEAGFYLLAPALLFLSGSIHSALECGVFFIALSITRNQVFNLFYNHLLRKK